MACVVKAVYAFMRSKSLYPCTCVFVGGRRESRSITEVLCSGLACCFPLNPLPYKSVKTCNLQLCMQLITLAYAGTACSGFGICKGTAMCPKGQDALLLW
jgi:hypothetical protein